MNEFFTKSTWVAILGVSLGLLLGFLFASGLEFDKGEGAKFAGSLLGSIIAVSGAVGLYYLKEIETKNERRRHVKSLLDRSIAFAEIARNKMNENSGQKSAYRTFIHQLERVVRFSEKYEHDDFAISEVYAMIAVSKLNQFDIGIHGDFDEKVKESCLKTIDSYGILLKNASKQLSIEVGK